MKSFILFFGILTCCLSCNNKDSSSKEVISKKNLLTDYPPIDDNANLNVVIEIPTGTIDKWEVNKETGNLKWELRNGKPRKINYLGYPGNYGMIPCTLLPKDLGGDGDPLDVIVLGPSAERGSVVKTQLIGVLRLLDRGEQDDKLIAVMSDSPFDKVTSLQELNQSFTGISTIIETFFTNYKGPNKMKSLGFGNKKEAEKILSSAIEAFKQKQ